MSNTMIPYNPGRSAERAAPKSNKKKSVKNKSRIRKASIRSPRERVQVLSPCSLHYLSALTDPFEAFTRHGPPCIPDLLDSMSYKFCSRTRGQMTLNASGLGFLGVSPQDCRGGTPTWPLGAGYVTNGLYNLQSFPTSVANISHIFPFNVPNSPYQAGSTDVMFRTVACGIRVRYIGTELNRGGFILPAYNPTLTLGGQTAADILASNSYQTFPVDRKWHAVFWRPLNAAQSEPRITNVGAATQTNLGIVVSGVPDTIAFEYEVVWYFEVFPTAVTALAQLSKSESDVPGLSRVRDYVSQLSNSVGGRAIYEQGLAYIKKMALSSLSGVAGGLLIDL